jgi:hypothetical protein
MERESKRNRTSYGHLCMDGELQNDGRRIEKPERHIYSPEIEEF